MYHNYLYTGPGLKSFLCLLRHFLSLFGLLLCGLVPHGLQDGMSTERLHVGVKAQHDVKILQWILLLTSSNRLRPVERNTNQKVQL